MPGRIFITTPLAEVAATFGATLEGDDPGPSLDAAPGEACAVLTAGRRLTPMRWGMMAMGRVNARKRPVMETLVNARAETLFDKSAYEGVRRGALIANGWYEWTGKPRSKIRWTIDDPASPLLAFAAVWDLWRGPGGVEVASFATVTVDPNTDLRDIHHRMPAILSEEALAIWLSEGDGAPAEMLAPWPDGRLRIRDLGEPLAAEAPRP